MTSELRQAIEAGWERRDAVDVATVGGLRDSVEAALRLLDSGAARVAEKGADGWIVNQWLKKAVLLSFRLNPMETIAGGPGGAHWWDKVPSKFAGWGEREFEAAGFRAVPGAIVRSSPLIPRLQPPLRAIRRDRRRESRRNRGCNRDYRVRCRCRSTPSSCRAPWRA